MDSACKKVLQALANLEFNTNIELSETAESLENIINDEEYSSVDINNIIDDLLFEADNIRDYLNDFIETLENC